MPSNNGTRECGVLLSDVDRVADDLVACHGLTYGTDEGYHAAFSDLLDTFPAIEADVLSERLAAAILYAETRATNWVEACPICEDPIDYCQGHGEIAGSL